MDLGRQLRGQQAADALLGRPGPHSTSRSWCCGPRTASRTTSPPPRSTPSSPGRAGGLGRLRGRPGGPPRPRRAPAASALRLPPPARLHRRRRRRVRPLLERRAHHLGRASGRSARRRAPSTAGRRRSPSTSCATASRPHSRSPSARGRRRRWRRRGRSRVSSRPRCIAACAISVMSGESRCACTVAAADSHFSITRKRPPW